MAEGGQQGPTHREGQQTSTTTTSTQSTTSNAYELVTF